jgi:uncharacterized protein
LEARKGDAVIIGLLTIELQVPESGSLKHKRQVVRSLVARIRQGFNVSVAEVDHLDSWQLATLAVTCVSGEASVVQQVMQRVVEFVNEQRLDLVLLEYQTELL